VDEGDDKFHVTAVGSRASLNMLQMKFKQEFSKHSALAVAIQVTL
jgi:hypothetical protein